MSSCPATHTNTQPTLGRCNSGAPSGSPPGSSGAPSRTRADPATGRWPASVIAASAARYLEILRAVGSVPAIGAVGAASHLSQRFGVGVHPDIMIELDRKGLIPVVDGHKGFRFYDGRALERFHDRGALEAALTDARLLTLAGAAKHLAVRRCDVAHLVRAGWLDPVTRVASVFRRRRRPSSTLLLRVSDLDVLRAHPAIDWDAVRATPKGRPSELAGLATAHEPPPPTPACACLPAGDPPIATVLDQLDPAPLPAH